jgi:hypothetical protein
LHHAAETVTPSASSPDRSLDTAQTVELIDYSSHLAIPQTGEIVLRFSRFPMIATKMSQYLNDNGVHWHLRRISRRLEATMSIHIIATGAAICTRVALIGRRTHRVGRRLGPAIAEFCRAAVRHVIDPYRPELHYMRGPGPKWREQHVRARRRAG